MKHNKMLAVCCLVLMVGNIIAQEPKKAAVTVSLKGGASSLGFKVNGLDGREGTTNSSIGFGLSAMYNYYFSGNIGFGAGLGYSSYGSNALLHGGMDDANLYSLGSYTDDDDSGLPRSFNLRARVENIKEKQTLGFLEIPVALLFQTSYSFRKWGAYGGVGIKLQIPVSKQFAATGYSQSRLNVSGLYVDGTQGFDMGAPGTPAVAYHGFGTVDNPGKALNWKKNATDLKTGIAGTLDLGLTNRISLNNDLLIGAYLDYGLSDIKKSNGSLLSGPSGSYHPAANDNIGKGIVYNGLFNSNHTDQIKLLSFGVKVGVRFKL